MGARRRRVSLLPAVAVTLALCACAVTPEQRFATVDELFTAAGGQEWCGTELSVTLPPAVGSCGTSEDRVVLGAAYQARGDLLESVEGALDGDFVVLVPEDVDYDDWFQLRAVDPRLLEEARQSLGGRLLDGDEDIEEWLAKHGG